jgi:HEAT repeat protein
LTLVEAAGRANELAAAGDERALADLRREWDDEVEAAARNGDYRVRAIAYRAIGQFRYRQKIELLRRGLEDESPACRGSALVSLELLSRDAPAPVNQSRRLLHELASHDPNDAVRRLAIICLKNGSPARETVVLLSGLAQDDDESRDLRDAAQKVAATLTKKSRAR